MRHSYGNPLVRLCVVNLLGGSALGAGFAALCLIRDLASLRTLIFSSDEAVTAMILLFLGFALIFATAVIAGASCRFLRRTKALMEGAARSACDLAWTARRPEPANQGRDFARQDRQKALLTRVTVDLKNPIFISGGIAITAAVRRPVRDGVLFRGHCG